jgi:hypothetical protein
MSQFANFTVKQIDLIAQALLLRKLRNPLAGHNGQSDSNLEFIKLPLVGVWGAMEQLWNAFHNGSVAPHRPSSTLTTTSWT